MNHADSLTVNSQPIFCILQEKGGTRKTFLASIIQAFFELHGQATSLVDADLSAGHLLNLYQDALSISYDSVGLGEFKSTLAKGLPTIVDFGANTSSHASILIKAAAESPNAKPVILCPFENNEKSQIYLLQYIDEYPNIPVFAVAVAWDNAPPPTPPRSIPESRIIVLPELSSRLVARYAAGKFSPAAIASGKFSVREHSPEAVSMRAYLRRIAADLRKVPGIPSFE
jgi:hypothetical protein